MKTTKLFLMGLIAFGLGFTACNTNDDDMPEIEKGEKARVSIRMAVNSQGTRLTGDITHDGLLADESAIKSLEVWLFNQEGRLETHRSASSKDIENAIVENAADPKADFQFFGGSRFVFNGIETTAGTKYLVMAANTDFGTTGITRVEHLTAKFETATQDISSGMVMTSLVTRVQIAAGENIFGQPPSGHHHDGDPNVNQLSPIPSGETVAPPLWLTRINARVALAKLEFEFTKWDMDDSESPIHGLTGVKLFDGSFVEFDRFELADVVVLNAREQSKLFVEKRTDRLWTGNTFIYGMDLPPFGGDQFKKDTELSTFSASVPSLVVSSNVPQAKGVNVIGATLFDRANQDEVPYFYIFENGAIESGKAVPVAGEKTMLIIKGKLFNGVEPITAKDLFDNVCSAGFTYYTIFVGKDYTNIGTDLIAFDGTVYRNTQYNFSVTLTGPGYNKVGDPTAKLDVLCDVEPWKVADQIITF